MPNKNFSGGNLEIARLENELSILGWDVHVATLFNSKINNKFLAFVNYIKRSMQLLYTIALRKPVVITTHYSTLPIGLLNHWNHSIAYIQDLEWKFSKPGIFSALLKLFILLAIRFHDSIVITSDKLFDSLLRHSRYFGLANYIQNKPTFTFPPGDLVFLRSALLESISHYPQSPREYDLCMILRKGHHKCAHLYANTVDYLDALCAKRLRIAVVDPSNIRTLANFRNNYDTIDVDFFDLLSQPVLHGVMSNSLIFIGLSNHEGFGLTPMEAVCFGCIPFIRENIGTNYYMSGLPEICPDQGCNAYRLSLAISSLVALSSDKLDVIKEQVQRQTLDYLNHSIHELHGSIKDLDVHLNTILKSL